MSRSLPARVVLSALRFYQGAVSPLLGPRCRYQPSCSAYAVEAVERRGAARGSALAARRLLRCQPLSRGGWDPVPEVGERPSRPWVWSRRGTPAAGRVPSERPDQQSRVRSPGARPC